MTVYIQTRERPSPIHVMLRNVAAHYPIRKASWYMAAMTFLVGVVLTINPTLLTTSIGATSYFDHMTRMAPQAIWRALFLIVGTSRLMALLINGSFPAITWTPLVRLIMSGISALLWFQVALSVIWGPFTIGTVVYPFIVIIEVENAFQAWHDARGHDGGRY